jgi:hypothetical protein
MSLRADAHIRQKQHDHTTLSFFMSPKVTIRVCLMKISSELNCDPTLVWVKNWVELEATEFWVEYVTSFGRLFNIHTNMYDIQKQKDTVSKSMRRPVWTCSRMNWFQGWLDQIKVLHHSRHKSIGLDKHLKGRKPDW